MVATGGSDAERTARGGAGRSPQGTAGAARRRPVHVTGTGGAWRNVTPKAVKGLYVAFISASAHEPQTAYAAVDGHRSDAMTPNVLMTTNLGKSWSSITGDLPKEEPVKVIIEDPSNNDVLYAGTQFFAYVTFDRGGHWLKLNGTSLPPAPVDDMLIHPRARDLVVGTHGRSIWILDDISMLGQLTAENRAKPLAVFDMLPAKPRIYMARDYGNAQGIFRAKNPPMGAYINYWVNEAGACRYRWRCIRFVVRARRRRVAASTASSGTFNRQKYALSGSPNEQPGRNSSSAGSTR
jgi:hypothetical protein